MESGMSDYRVYKAEIENKLNNIELEEAGKLILEYEERAPMDMDIITYKCLYFLYSNELESALQYALLGVRRYPMNGDMYYNLACVYEMMEEWLLACKNYVKAQFIYEYINDEKQELLQIKEKLDEIWNQIDLQVIEAKKNGDGKYIRNVQEYTEHFKTYFGLENKAYTSPVEQVIGGYQWISDDEKKYIAFYRVELPVLAGANSRDLVHMKGEFLTVNEGYSCKIAGEADEYLLPIAVDQGYTIHQFIQDNQQYQVLQGQEKLFSYYRVKRGTEVISDEKSYYGNPIPLGHSPNRKKLILNIFVDGLSQEILNGENFKKLMPYTYAFFSEGIICTQAYSTAEWTYPSLANIVTGTDTPNHMLFHDKLDGYIPRDIPTLAEYFHEAGYYTAHLTGNWRIIPPYGHCRGYERYIYQNPAMGSKAEIMLADTLEQLEGFQDTDQFVWICMEDLHDIADMLEMPIGVQRTMELKEWVRDEKGITSVKSSYSPNKIAAYKKMANHIDMLLGSIYAYISDRYSDDEIIVSLFADHGQGFLVPENEKFMCKEREKIAFMFRGDLPGKISDEIISAGDYISIMCKLAGITIKDVHTASNLPVCFGGNQEREYALSESIHPKDPYYATFFTKEYTVYFENGVPTGEDGRFELRDYSLTIKDVNGKVMDDRELSDRYMKLVMEHIAPLIIY